MSAVPGLRAHRVFGEDISAAVAAVAALGGALVAAAAVWAFVRADGDAIAAATGPGAPTATAAAPAAGRAADPATAAAGTPSASDAPGATGTAVGAGPGVTGRPAPVPGDCPAPLELRFQTASAALDPAAARGTLTPLVSWLKAHPDARLVIQGHADARGDDQANLALSFRRATAVAGVLDAMGVPPRQAVVQAAGHRDPIEGLAPLADENRRVVLAVRDAAGCPRSR